MKYFIFFLPVLCMATSVFGQMVKEKREKFPSHFAFQVRGLVPNKFSEPRTNTVFNDTLRSSITSNYGFSFGGIIRRRYTDRLGIEVGLNLSKRYYGLTTALPDSNLYFERGFAFTTFELPLNGLVFVKLSERVFTNAALGASIIYKPSSVSVGGKAGFKEGKNEFSIAGIVEQKFNINLNAQLGFEYLSDKKGIFYFGGSAHIPTAPLFYFLSRYSYANSDVNSAVVYNQRSPFFTFDLRYYFPTIKNKGDQPLRGPIE
jgi:hypothetical protein